jgi:ABC-2 type transport system ATP-binding protein
MWQFLKEINQAGTTIILTTHYLEEAENLCRHVAIIDGGRLIQHHPMADFLRTLRQQTYLVATLDPVSEIPRLDGFVVSQINEYELEIEVRRENNLNEMFAALNSAGIRVVSMRNKTNRLEELFFDLTERKNAVSDEGIA